jgi:hypothetical protein
MKVKWGALAIENGKVQKRYFTKSSPDAAHDKWFREQVDAALAEADAPGQKWVSNADAKEHFAAKRKALQARAAKA